MKISREALNEFKEIYKKEFGVELTDKDALDKSIRLLSLFKAVYRPIPFETELLSVSRKGLDR